LLDHGIEADYSCQDGVCGTCEVKVVSGVPDHRDSLLSKAERESNKTMMICVSRCVGDHLTLDL
jgi:tetrachlorobenzoquinone reductase